MNSHARLNRVTRRNILKGVLGAGGALAATGLIGARQFQDFAAANIASGTDTDAWASVSEGLPKLSLNALLNLAATLEGLALTYYHSVFSGATFYIESDDAAHLRQITDTEAHHLEVWRALGGLPQADKYYLPKHTLADAGTFVTTGLALETTSLGAYLALSYQLAQLGEPKLATTAAQHAASEAQHHTLLSHIAGLPPDHLTLPAPLVQASDALAQLKVFLVGEGESDEMEPVPAAAPAAAPVSATLAARRGVPFALAG